MSESHPQDECVSVDTGELPLDLVFSVLSQERRRQLLYILEAGDPPHAIETLAERIAAVETDRPLSRVRPGDRRDVETSLRHVHLPKLAEHGIVEYDIEQGRVTPGESFGALDVFVELAKRDDEFEPDRIF